MFAVWLVRYMRSKDSSPPAPRWAWLAVIIGIFGTIGMIIWFHVWQDDVRDLMGVPRLKWHDYPVAAVLSIVVLFVLVEIGQLVGRLIRFLVRSSIGLRRHGFRRCTVVLLLNCPAQRAS